MHIFLPHKKKIQFYNMYDKFLVFLCVCQLSDQVSLIIFFAATIAKSPMYKNQQKF